MPSLPQIGFAARQARIKLANALASGRFSRRAGQHGPVPDDGVAVFFATGPENAYQFEQWRRPLEALAPRHRIFVVVNRPDTGELILRSSTLPMAYAARSGDLEGLVEGRRVRAVLYLNQVDPNFRMLRFADPVHIQLGHGESDKGGSVSNQHKAYDLTFVGGEAGRERLGRALHDFDAEQRTRLIGRPQLDYDYPGAPDWLRAGELRVLYAPTWEGDRPTIRYGSLVSHGAAIIESLRSDPRVRVVYRPHPRTGTVSRPHAEADRAIRRLLQADGDRHLVDTGAYGWQWDFADACVTDISAVAYDWLATGKSLVITEPAELRAYRPPSALLDTLPLLPADRAAAVVTMLAAPPTAQLRPLAAHYFGDTTRGTGTRRFEAELENAIQDRERHLRPAV